MSEVVCELASCGRKFPHFGTSLVPLGPTHWFCNENHYKRWAKEKTAKPAQSQSRLKGKSICGKCADAIDAQAREWWGVHLSVLAAVTFNQTPESECEFWAHRALRHVKSMTGYGVLVKDSEMV